MLSFYSVVLYNIFFVKLAFKYFSYGFHFWFIMKIVNLLRYLNTHDSNLCKSFKISRVPVFQKYNSCHLILSEVRYVLLRLLAMFRPGKIAIMA